MKPFAFELGYELIGQETPDRVEPVAILSESVVKPIRCEPQTQDNL